MSEAISGEVVTATDMELRSDVDALDQMDSEAREVAVTGILQQSRDWLVRAQTATDPARAVSEFKAYIATVAETSKQLKLSKEIQQDALVMVRRAERSLGVAIRSGQENGSISSRGTNANRGNQYKSGESGNSSFSTKSPSDYAERRDIDPGSGGIAIYRFADNISDADFEDALDQAQSENDLRRTNVARKLTAGKGTYKSRAEPTRGNRRRAEKQLNVFRNITLSLSTTEMAITDLLKAGIDPAVTREEADEVIADLNQFARVIGQIKKQLNK